MEFFDYPREGVLQSKANERLVVMSMTALQIGMQEVQKNFGQAWPALAYHIGESYGRGIVVRLHSESIKDPKAIMNYLTLAGKVGGWGVYEMVIIDTKREHVVVTIRDNAFFDMEGGCFFVKGTVKGLVDAALPSQKRHKIEEVKHSSKECEFEMMLG